MNNIGNEVTRLYAKELAKNPVKNNKNIINKEIGVLLGISFASVIIFLLVFVHYWTKYIYLEQAIYSHESQMEKEYQRRTDLQVKLLDIAKEYAGHEREVFKYVSDARVIRKSAEKLENVLSATKSAEMDKAMSRLMALAEQYPDLKATRSFQLLMEMNETTENRIASTRDKYIALTREYNSGLLSFPDNMFNVILRFKKIEFYKAEEDSAPVPMINNTNLLEKEGK